MLDSIINLDYYLAVYLNNLGNTTADKLWLFITNQFYLTPFFLYLFYLIKKKLSWKEVAILVLTLAVLITCTDGLTNIVKKLVERPRPINTDAISDQLRIIITRKSFSFFSGHASNSMAATTLIFLALRKHYKYFFLIFLFPLIFAYSRIYLALHFTSDILTGYFVGIILALFFHQFYKIILIKYNK